MYNQYHDFALELIKTTDQIILNNFQKVISLEKHTGDLVTEVDKQIELIITNKIKQKFPNHNVYGEEFGGNTSFKNFTWIIDPLDGTNNYALGIPMAGTAITLLKDKKVIMSIISYPFVGKVFSAYIGSGTLLNGKQLTKPNCLKSKRISILVGYSTVKNHFEYSKFLDYRKSLQLESNRIFETWCPVVDFTLLLEGYLDSIIFYSNEFYDSLRGIFLAEELGYSVTHNNQKYSFSGELTVNAKITSMSKFEID